MNGVFLMGRITKDPEEKKVKVKDEEISSVQFILAVNRERKNANGEYDTDFVPCQAFRNTSEIICKYVKKGDKIAIKGKIMTGSYKDKETDKTVYTVKVVADGIEFASKAGNSQNTDFVGGLAEEMPFR